MDLFLISLGIFTYEVVYNKELRDKLIAAIKQLIAKIKKTPKSRDAFADPTVADPVPTFNRPTPPRPGESNPSAPTNS